MKEKRRDKIRKIFYDHGPVVKASVLREGRLCSRDIAELVSDGFVKKHRTGYYSWIDTDDAMSDIELAASLIPNSIICLYSAAVYYDLTTVNPMAVTLAVSSGTTKPVLPIYPPVEIYVFSRSFFALGETTERLAHADIRIYDRERTVCDFFRLRNQLGEDVVLEVLKNYMARQDKNLQCLMEYAGRLRIRTKIKPYVEALL